ncbi:uncharacterized protein LOC115785190 [Archocentrus centrarchus]|uniref:uncharacterized protein LOC115785190 n=1 Tax=Archocentrus centrarchus TaxID=63155 RepID=UPI0011E9D886|nr:uncharacterized protein LOC115785190 [Archocentrus centrarchus]
MTERRDQTMDPADIRTLSEQEEKIQELKDFSERIVQAPTSHHRLIQLAFCCGLISSSTWLLTHPHTASLAHSIIMLRKNLQYELHNIGRPVQGRDSNFFLQAITNAPLLQPDGLSSSPPLHGPSSPPALPCSPALPSSIPLTSPQDPSGITPRTLSPLHAQATTSVSTTGLDIIAASDETFSHSTVAQPDLCWLPQDVEIIDSPLLVDILDAENRASHSNRKRRKQRTRHRHAPPRSRSPLSAVMPARLQEPQVPPASVKPGNGS